MKKTITKQLTRFNRHLFKPGLLLVVCFLCAFTGVKAQTATVTGVVSSTDGTLIPGVTIIEKGTQNATVTGTAGQFRLSVHPFAIITVRSIGYDTVDVKTDNSGKPMSIVMRENTRQLNDVVVVGYGTQSKKTFAGSAVVLNADEMNKSSLSLANMIQGKAAGVQVDQNNGTPGAALTIRIRGTNSINSSSDPLYVIDGFPTNDGVGVTISPQDIESVSILKDAASTSIYGARGANGVILITTKSGKNKKGSLTGETSIGYQKVSNLYNLAGPYANATRLNAIDVASGSTAPYTPGRLDSLKDGSIPGTDWQKVLFKIGRIQNSTLSFTGGSANTDVYGSLDYLDQDGIVIDSRYKRIGGRVNVDQKIGDKFTMSAHVFGYYGIQNDLPLAPSTINGFLKQAIEANPASNFGVDDNVRGDAQNPLYFIAATDRENTVTRDNGYLSLKYEPIKGLVFQSDQGADLNSSKILYFAPSTVPAGVSGHGLGTITNIDETELIINPTITYSFNIHNDHHFKALIGFNQQVYYYWEQGITATDFNSDALGYDNLATASQFSAYSDQSRLKRQSWFSRLDYDYKNKYIVSGSYRADGSNELGAGNKIGYFGAGSFAWRFDQEEFIKRLDIFSSGKLRASYGSVGNDRGVPDAITLATYASNATTSYTLDGVDQISGIAVTQLANPNVKWERTNSLDLGLDVGFLRDRITVEMDYYNKKTTDLLLDQSIAPSTGFQTLFGNDGAMLNRGFEIAVATQNLTGKFKWNTGFTFSFNQNKVLSLGSNNSPIYVGSLKPDGSADFESPFIVQVGEPINSIYGYKYAGVLQKGDPALTTTQKNAQPGDPKFVDEDHNGTIESGDRVILGTGVPDAFYGLTNTFMYGNFQLDIVTQAQTGGSLLNLMKEDLEYPLSNGNTLNTVPKDVWSPTNTSGTIPATGFYGSYGGWVNSNYVESSNYIRIKNVNLQYNFPAGMLKNVGIAGLSIYVNAQNLVTFTKYTGLDPEVGNLTDNTALSQNGGRGIDFNAYPVNRMYILGAKITF